MKIVDIDGGVYDDLVYAPPEELQSSDNGGTQVSEAELIKEEEVDPKRSERCVYYQNDEGLWKCRKCCWTYQSERVSSDDIQNSKQQLHRPKHFKTVNQQGPCFSRETKDTGTGSTRRLFCDGQSSNEHSGSEKIHGDSLSGSNLLPSEISPEEDDTSFNFSSYKAIESTDSNLLYESDHEATQFYVEKVLRKQDTYDLYCPNCKSFITSRVIIRKRKHRLPIPGEVSKRNKVESGTGSDPISTSVATTSNPSHSTVDTCLNGSAAPTSNNYNQDQEPDVFRCLSCFSIFTPTGNGFKLLRMFGDKRDKDNLQDSPQTPVVKKNWFSTLFQSDKRVGGMADVETDDTEVFISSSHARTDLGGETVKTGAEESTEGGTSNLPPQKVSLGKPGGQDNLEDQVSMNVNKQNEEASRDEAPSHAIYADGETVQSEITGSKEGGNKVLSPPSKRFTEYDTYLVGSREISDSSVRKSKEGASLEQSVATFNLLESLNLVQK